MKILLMLAASALTATVVLPTVSQGQVHAQTLEPLAAAVPVPPMLSMRA